MNFIELFSILIFSLYFIFVLLVAIGFSKKKETQIKNNIVLGISVLIPFKDEEANLSRIILSLKHQKHSPFEVIFINDHSSDKSVEIIKDALNSNQDFKLIHLEGNEFGKKAAIEKGVLNAKYDFILTTDADCVFSEKWILTHANEFKNGSSIITGRVEIENGTGFWNKFQQLEMISIQCVSIGMANLGHPISISGANLSYRKDLFSSINPYSENKSTLSGDDIFLLQAMRKKGMRLEFLNSDDSTVVTKSQIFQNFISQRIRWMKKSSSFQDLTTVLIGLVIFLSSFQFLFITGYQLFTLETNYLLFISGSLKIILDFLLLFLVTHHWKKKRLLFGFPLIFLMNVFFTTLIPIMGWLIPVRWKGRKI
jgi:biofilm PGA synthesis N-glycosyltransferase PgaC